MQAAYIGFDVGGTNIAAGLVSKQGKVLKLLSCPTEGNKGKKQVAQNTLAVIEELLSKNIKCLGVCLAWPGPANMPPNIPLSGREIKKIVEEKYDFPVFLENDANLFTLTEATTGQAKKYKIVTGVTLGTGIGCGLVVDRKIYRGRGEASEFGHVSLNFDGPRCACGNKGCFEEYAGSRPLKRLAKKYNLKAKNGEDLYDLAKQGNKGALKVWQDFGRQLGWGLKSVIHAYDPDIIILGGQISKAHKFFRASMHKELKTKALFKLPIIKVSKLDNAAIMAAAIVNKKSFL